MDYIIIEVFFQSDAVLNDYYSRNYGEDDFLILSSNGGVQRVALF